MDTVVRFVENFVVFSHEKQLKITSFLSSLISAEKKRQQVGGRNATRDDVARDRTSHESLVDPERRGYPSVVV